MWFISLIYLSFHPDLTVGLITGGKIPNSFGGLPGIPQSSAEVFGGGDCTVADLPETRLHHVSFVTPDDIVMVCGGLVGGSQLRSKSCLEYDLNSGNGKWRHHSNMRLTRPRAAAVSFPWGVIVLGGPFEYEYVQEWIPGKMECFGGYWVSQCNLWTGCQSEFIGGTCVWIAGKWLPQLINNAWSSDLLHKGSKYWVEGPYLPVEFDGLAYSDALCAVAIDDTRMLVIGIATQYKNVWEWSSLTYMWYKWPATFRYERHASACHKVGDTVVVAGGYYGGAPGDRSTEVLDLNSRTIREEGHTATPRMFFGFLEMGLSDSTLILTFGGGKNDWGKEESSVLQEWDPNNKTWNFSPSVLRTRDSFSSVSLKANLVCKATIFYPSLRDTLKKLEDGSIEWCKRDSDGNRLLGERKVARCFVMPSYGLSHCIRYSDRFANWLTKKWPCCCAHPDVRDKGKFKPICDEMFRNF